VIVIDTSVLIDALTGPRRSGTALRAAIADGRRLLLPSLVLYEWLRGPRVDAELAAQEAILPSDEALPFGALEGRLAADLYDAVDDPRGREVDLAIASYAIAREARVWTLNIRDFEDLPGLKLYEP
jgi:predicted nucleic acid-binding protein